MTFHKTCMQDEGVCPRCGRDLNADRQAERHFEDKIAPLVQKRYGTLKTSTLLMSASLLYFLIRRERPGTLIPHFVMPVVMVVLLIALHLIESRCPHCKAWIFLLGKPESCNRCKGRLI